MKFSEALERLAKVTEVFGDIDIQSAEIDASMQPRIQLRFDDFKRMFVGRECERDRAYNHFSITVDGCRFVAVSKPVPELETVTL